MTIILIVDDEEPVRNMLRQMLQKEGYAVLDAPNGKMAQEVLSKYRVDLMLLDIFMPEQDGIETLAQLRRSKSKPPKVIAISGGRRKWDVKPLQLAHLMGAQKTLAKPFERKELFETIHGLMKSPHK